MCPCFLFHFPDLCIGIGILASECISLSSFLPSFLPSFLSYFLLSFLPSFVPFFHSSSFFPSLLTSFLPSLIPSFLSSFLRSFLTSCLPSVSYQDGSRLTVVEGARVPTKPDGEGTGTHALVRTHPLRRAFLYGQDRQRGHLHVFALLPERTHATQACTLYARTYVATKSRILVFCFCLLCYEQVSWEYDPCLFSLFVSFRFFSLFF